ncbi:MAG: bifunctional adenosylcobinamide kinase/adenosylcobinamide-phosphate guanylyltransferase [Nitrospirota bacterium]
MVITILGGIRSGKSSFALKVSDKFNGEKIFLATAEPLDPEMRERIERHKMSRSNEWRTIEEPIKIYDVLKKLSQLNGVVLIDCLTLWLSNMMREHSDDRTIIEEIEILCRGISEINCSIILVSNEVGLAIIPENRMARRFCDLSGIMNQKVVEVSDEAYMIFSGSSIRIK